MFYPVVADNTATNAVRAGIGAFMGNAVKPTSLVVSPSSAATSASTGHTIPNPILPPEPDVVEVTETVVQTKTTTILVDPSPPIPSTTVTELPTFSPVPVLKQPIVSTPVTTSPSSTGSSSLPPAPSLPTPSPPTPSPPAPSPPTPPPPTPEPVSLTSSTSTSITTPITLPGPTTLLALPSPSTTTSIISSPTSTTNPPSSTPITSLISTQPTPSSPSPGTIILTSTHTLSPELITSTTLFSTPIFSFTLHQPKSTVSEIRTLTVIPVPLPSSSPLAMSTNDPHTPTLTRRVTMEEFKANWRTYVGFTCGIIGLVALWFFVECWEGTWCCSGMGEKRRARKERKRERRMQRQMEREGRMQGDEVV